ncbi:InlB B-repeat-containing protein [Thalassotalea fusca]
MALLPKLVLAVCCIIAFSGCQSSDSSKKNEIPLHNEYNLTLTVESNSNANRIQIKPLEKTCSSACIERVSENTTVELIPLSDDESEFVGWEGDCSNSTNCVLNINGDKKVNAIFEQKFASKLNVHIVGQGDVAVNGRPMQCGSSCQHTYVTGSRITLTAIPGSSYQFSTWQDAVFGCSTSETCRIVLNDDVQITAIFHDTSDTKTLSLDFLGNGTGEVGIVGQQSSCTNDCQLAMPEQETIELYATPTGNNTVFSGWAGCDDTNNGNCIVSTSQHQNVSATFDTVQSTTLTINIEGNGSVKTGDDTINCSQNCQVSVANGSPLTLLAVADNGYELAQWNNQCSTSISCQVTPSGPLTVSVTFKESLFDKESNTILITEPLGETRINHPIQIGRPFIKGEIANFPVAVIDGIAIPTQSNVKQRYDDGSVKHAIISFVIDNLPAYSSLAITFENQATMNETGMTKEEMLSDSTSLFASMSFSFPESGQKTVSARDMIIHDHYDTWLSGPIASTVLLRDHSVNRIYDVGNDHHKSVRPMFYITFWPTINKYQVRYIAENANTETLQDQTYGVDISIDDSSLSFYSKSNIPHQAMSRWTKVRWSGGQVLPISINHNVNYLAKTKRIPNFDTSVIIDNGVIESDWAKWENKPKDIYDSGLWQRAMATAGGRPDIGLYPSWTVKWIFTGDWRHQEIALTQSDLASAWPMHLREGDTGRKFDFAESVDAIGQVVSMAPKARPKHWVSRPDWHEIPENDKIEFVGEHAKTAWRPDSAHHPDISSPQYLLTGEYFYLEEMIFSAAFTGGNNNAQAKPYRYGRGPTGSEGALYSGEVRGQAWNLRTRVHTYDILPDDMPDKEYLHQLTKNAISMFEGLFSLTNSYPELQDLYDHAKNTVQKHAFTYSGVPSPNGNWHEGISSPSYVKDTMINTNFVNRATAPWMHNFVIVALGRTKELGFKSENLLKYAGNQLAGPFEDSSIDHVMFSAYVVPTLDENNQWFTSFSNKFQHYNPDYVATTTYRLANESDTEHGYYSIGMAAASYLTEDENFPALWQFIEDNVRVKEAYSRNPKWLLLPR